MNVDEMWGKAEKTAKIINEINKKFKELGFPEVPFENFMNLSYNQMQETLTTLQKIKKEI